MHFIIPVLLASLALYLGAGVLFAAVFHARGLIRVDPSARGAGLGFRAIVTPGIVALWPVMLRRWRMVATIGKPIEPTPLDSAPRRLRAVHSAAWKILVVLGPVIVALALASRPAERPPSLAPWAPHPGSQPNHSR